jgi:hypothetical protein
MDPTNKDSAVRKGFRAIDPTMIGHVNAADMTGLQAAQDRMTDRQDWLGQMYDAAGKRQAPTLPQMDRINRNSIQNAQATQLGQSPTVAASQFANIDPRALELQRQAAMGLAPSQATGMLQQGISQAGQLGMALAGARGGYSPAAVRGAQRQMSASVQDASAQAAQIRAVEMATARQAYGDLSMGVAELNAKQAELTQQANMYNASQRGQYELAQADLNLRAQLANQGVDLDVMKTNAARGDAYALANLQASLATMGMNDAMQLAYVSQITGIDAQLLGAEAQKVALESQRQAALAKNRTDIMLPGVRAIGDLLGKLASSGGGNSGAGVNGAPGTTGSGAYTPYGGPIYEGGEPIPMEGAGVDPNIPYPQQQPSPIQPTGERSPWDWQVGLNNSINTRFSR